MAHLDPYPKITQKMEPDSDGEPRGWVATEKLHGAHFAVVCDSTGVHPAKRRQVLTGDLLDGFFGVSRIWPRLAVAADRFATMVRQANAKAATGEEPVVTIYGELIGGRYPHPDVATVAGIDPVQTGVWYAPDLHWLVFDARLTGGDRCDWIADDLLRQIAAAVGIVCVPGLGHGRLNVLRELPDRFPSGVPRLLRLPELDDNLAEGYVLKPAGDWNDAAGDRPVIKVKQPAFAEDARYLGSQPYRPPMDGAAGVPAWLLLEAATRLTPARASAAVSKIGPGSDPKTVAGEIVDDVVEEIAADIGGLDEPLARSLTGVLRPAAADLARFDAADRRAHR